MPADLAQIVQLIVNGVAIGSIYALVAAGLVMTYKATEVLNFAHGDLLMASAFVCWGLITLAGWPFWLAAPATIAAIALLAALIDMLAMRRIVGQPQFAGVMLTIAIGFMLRGAVSLTFGPDARNLPTPWSGQTTRVGGVVLTNLSFVIIVATLLVTIALFAFLGRTRAGISIQAASQNQLAAYLSGIRVKWVNSLVWAIAGALAALCGILLAPTALVDISLWHVVLKSLAALVLGGFGSIAGALVGGIGIGLIEQFAGVYMPDGVKDIVAYVILIVMLIVWPRGLLGEAHGRRV
jgi:branched-chain amino acid transport system permease protein